MDMKIDRRKFLIGSSILGIGAICSFAFSEPEENVIFVIAKKFEFSPNEIHLKMGVPAILEFTSLDTLMGFNLPDFKVRTDIVPGMKSRLSFTPDKAGTFTFYCDIFCGSGHEDMNGLLIVS